MQGSALGPFSLLGSQCEAGKGPGGKKGRGKGLVKAAASALPEFAAPDHPPSVPRSSAPTRPNPRPGGGSGR